MFPRRQRIGILIVAAMMSTPGPASAYTVLWFHSAPTDGRYVKSLAFLAAGWPAPSSMDLDGDGVAELVNFNGDFITEVIMEIVDSKTGDVEYTYTVTVPPFEPTYFPHYAYFDADPSDPFHEVYVGLASGSAAFVVSGAASSAITPPSNPQGDAPPVLQSRILPNPVTTTAVIEFTSWQSAAAKVEVFDVSGRRVATPLDKVVAQGTHAVVWDGNNAEGRHVGPGTYFFRLQVGEMVETDKAVVIR